MLDIKMIYNNEKGMVLPLGLMFLAIISILGTTAVIVTTTDLKIGSNYRTSEQAFYAAEAGIEEARARLRGSSTAASYAGDPSATYDPWWSAYILTSGSWQTSDGPDHNGSYNNYIPTSFSHTNTTITANSLQTDISYFVKIRHKREYDAEQTGHTISSPQYYDGDGDTGTNSAATPGNIIYYGYKDNTSTTVEQFTTSGATEYKPVEIITGCGLSSNSRKIVEIEVKKNPGPPINSALYAKGDVTVNGVAADIIGNDNCSMSPPLPPIYTLSPSDTDPATNPEPPNEIYSGNPVDPAQGTDDINITDYVDSFKGSATEIITADQNGTNYGDAGNFVTCYCDATSLVPVPGLDMANLTGYGLLLVEGDLRLSGGFNWNGLILVTGTLTFNGGGPNSINIQGAVLANQTIDINGGVNIAYDSCMIDNSLNNQSLEIISWKEIY